jgi:epoxyqueuosine reductase
MIDFKDILCYAESRGADLVGVAPVESFPSGADDKLNPVYYLPGARHVLVIGLKMIDALWDRLEGTFTSVHNHNAVNYLMNYNYPTLDYITVQTARYIEKMGYDAYPIQAGSSSRKDNVLTGYFPFKEAARLAGLGVYGKHSLIITPEFGPRVRFAALITDLAISGGRSGAALPATESVCGKCVKCIEVCPVRAISFENGAPVIDRTKCQAYMDQAKFCTLCQAVCPLGIKAANERRALKDLK